MGLVTQARSLFQRRAVLRTLVIRDLRVRYAQSILGYVWTVLDPLLMSMIYFVVFVGIMKRQDLGHQPYFLFLVTGLLSWQWFSSATTDTSRALISEARLVRSTSLPREMWVLRVVASKGVEYFLALPVLLGFALVYLVRGELHLNGWLILFPLGVIVQFFSLMGIGMLLAPITVLVTDMERVVRIALRMGFYATPIIYTGHLVPEPWDRITWLNPLTGVVEAMRAGMFRHDKYPIMWGPIGLSVVMSVVLLLVGSYVFTRFERSVLKEI